MRDSFEAFFHHYTVPVCIVTDDGSLQACNAAMATFLGLPEAQTQGASLESLHKPLYAVWKDVSRDIVSTSRMVSFGERSLSTAFVRLPNSQWAITISLDKNASGSDLSSDLFYTVMHDLQNPISAIKGYANLVPAFGELNERQDKYIVRIMVAVEEMSELVSRLLDAAWVDANLPLALAPVDLALLTKASASGFTELAQKNKVTLHFDLADKVLVLADEKRLKQVINNLIGNAIKYSPDGGEVRIRIAQQNSEVEFSIEDQGLGIPAEHLPNIFDRFYRVPHETDHKIDGNGIGLSIGYEILKKHKATLHVESRVGEGSRFYFILPISSPVS